MIFQTFAFSLRGVAEVFLDEQSFLGKMKWAKNNLQFTIWILSKVLRGADDNVKSRINLFDKK
jgi:hypothetical protein